MRALKIRKTQKLPQHEEFVSYSDGFDFYFPTSDQHTDGVIKEINGLSINKSHFNEYHIDMIS